MTLPALPPSQLPRFRVSLTLRRDFDVEIHAADSDDARAIAEALPLDKLTPMGTADREAWDVEALPPALTRLTFLVEPGSFRPVGGACPDCGQLDVPRGHFGCDPQ